MKKLRTILWRNLAPPVLQRTVRAVRKLQRAARPHTTVTRVSRSGRVTTTTYRGKNYHARAGERVSRRQVRGRRGTFERG